MKTHRQLEKHKDKICLCGKRFILTSKQQNSDLLGSTKFPQITPLPIFCKSYFCPTCSKVKKSKFKKRIENGLLNDSWRFLTLTLNTRKYTVKDQFQIITRDWNKLNTVLKRRYPNLKFVRVVEIGKNKNVHMHVLVNHFLPKKLIQKYWYKYNFSFIVDISKVHKHKLVTAYVLKYLSKQMEDSQANDLLFIHSKRRISFSANWQKQLKEQSLFRLISSDLHDYHHLIDYLKKLIHLLNLNKSCFDLDYLPNPRDATEDIFNDPCFQNGFHYIVNKVTGEIKPYMENLSLPAGFTFYFE